MQLHTLGYKSLTRKTYFSFTVVQQVFVPNPPPSLLFRAICSTPSGAETYIKKTGFDASGESKQVRVSIWQAYCEQRFAAVLGIVLKTLFFKMDKPRPLFCLVLVFSNKQYQFYNNNICEKCPSSIRCQDSNQRPSERESLPITTRPGLPENCFSLVKRRQKSLLLSFNKLDTVPKTVISTQL